MRIPSGVTDQYIYFVAVDSTDFTSRETGLSSFTVYRSRNGAAAAAMTTPTINETDTTNMPGVYELLLDEDMTIGSGNDSEEMVFHITATGMAPVTRTIELYRPKITAGNTLGVAADGDVSGNVDGSVASVTAGVSLAAGAITNASLAGNMEIVFETDFATNYNQTRNAWATNVQDFVGTSGADPFNGQVVAASVTAGVTASTVSDKTGYSISGTITTLDGLENISAADVNAQCDTALSDIGLQYVVNTALPTNWTTDVTANSALDYMADNGTATFDRTTDSLQAVRDHIGDGTNLTEAGGDGDHLTAIDLPDQTMNITGNLSGSVGSVTAQVSADVTGVSGSATAANNLETLFDGNEGFYSAYSGPRGPGVYFNDAAANTNTANGVDGTIGNPVSTIAAATTIADSMSLDRIYMVNDSTFTAAQTYADYEFVGIGDPGANIVNLGDQIFTNCAFFNVNIQGDCSASSGRFYAENCLIQDESGAGTTTVHIHAYRCGIVDSFRVTNNDDHFLDQCFSMVAGNSTPTIDLNSGAGVDVCIRHYSGGIQIDNGSATATMSVETDGQVVVDATCNSAFALTVRGCASITDNATLSSLTQDATYNAGNVNEQVLDVLNTDTFAEPGQEAPGATVSLVTKIGYLYKAWRNRSTQDATTYSLYNDDASTVDQTATVSDNGTTADKGEVGSGP